jgi:pantetheine-phosphate adenylyltransferase
MAKERIGVYAGSFDPPTIGHLWMIEQGSKLFDKFIVAIGINPEKRYTFTPEERLLMLKQSIKEYPNTTLEIYNNQYLFNYAKKIGADFILRGSRNTEDFIREQGFNNLNRDYNQDITTILLMPPRDLCEVSSSSVKSLIGPEGWEDIVRRYVSPPVFDQIQQKYGRKESL